MHCPCIPSIYATWIINFDVAEILTWHVQDARSNTTIMVNRKWYNLVMMPNIGNKNPEMFNKDHISTSWFNQNEKTFLLYITQIHSSFAKYHKPNLHLCLLLAFLSSLSLVLLIINIFFSRLSFLHLCCWDLHPFIFALRPCIIITRCSHNRCKHTNAWPPIHFHQR